MSTTIQRPHSTLNPTTPSFSTPKTKKRPASLSVRTPLSDISSQDQAKHFQDRHRTQFAHLHQHSDDSLREKRLEAERAELEQARKLGREKRESVKAQRQASTTARGGRRPLSLVVRYARGSESDAVPISSSKGDRPNSMPLHLRANSDGGLVSPRVKTTRHSGLNVVVETPTSTHTTMEDMSPDTSISQSSYSWASQFSGETEELRTAARYVPKPNEEEEEELEEELVDEEDDVEVTPKDGTTRRRKKIVALAHTVRQLEGVGSREAEDPAFYDTLVKAWNERPVAGQSPNVISPGSGDGNSPLPFTPNLSNSNARHSEGSSVGLPYASSNTDRDSDGITRGSNSMRYSYASTLHDLAAEGGIEQANRIFLAKPWLRGSIIASSSGNQEFLNEQSYPKGDNRHLSLGDAPPPFGLASPIVMNGQQEENGHGLKKSKRSINPFPQAIDFTASPAPSPALTEDGSHDPSTVTSGSALAPAAGETDEATGWGLGFMGNWFAPSPDAQLVRSSTARFDDPEAVNDSFEDAEGESDPEYGYGTATEDGEEQDFHEAEEGVGTNTNPIPEIIEGQAEEKEEQKARPESMAMPSDLLEEQEGVYPPQTQLDATPKQADISLAPTPVADLSASVVGTDSPSSNHSPLPTYSTPSITSYPLSPLSLNLATPLNVNRVDQTFVTNTNNHEEIRSARGSCHSSDSCSSPSMNGTATSMGMGKRRGSRPSLTPILTGLTGLTTTDEEVHNDETKEGETELVKNLRDERFSNAYQLAQSLSIPTPSIKSPTRTSSINVLSMISPTLSQQGQMENSNHYFSQDLSDAETMMGGPAPVVRGRAASIVGTMGMTSPNMLLSPTTSNGRLAIPRRASANPAGGLVTLSRPSLIDTRAPTLGSISELGLGPRMQASGTVYSISGESERLAEFDDETDLDHDIDFGSRSDLGTPTSPSGRFSVSGSGSGHGSNMSLALPSPLDVRRSRLNVASLESLPTYLRPPSVSPSDSISHSGERPTSKYQAYQQHQIEMSRRANARVAAKMSGATAKELKVLEKAQRSPNLDSEKGQDLITPEPSTAAAVLFFLGFLGPWFWIFGGWMPMGHSSEIKRQERERLEQEQQGEMEMDGCSIMLDFSGAEKLPKGWKWTYHPDPWVRRNRRAAAILIPLYVMGGIGAAVALAIVLG